MSEYAFVPSNEQGLISLFSAKANDMGWTISSVGTKFPDAVLEKDGELWRVEFEYKAGNFISHGHNYTKCDLIVCWINNIGEFYVPIYSMSDDVWTNAVDATESLTERFYGKSRILKDPESSRYQLTARGNNEYKEKLEYIMNARSRKSMSDAILTLIDDEYMRLTSESKNVTHRDMAIIRLAIALVNGDVVADEDAAMKFYISELNKQ